MVDAAPPIRPESLAPERLVSEQLRALGFVHGFFTRRGGCSEGAYASLNTSASAGDEPARVADNVGAIERTLEVAPGALLYPSQVHGVDAVVLRGGETREEILAQRADLVVAERAGIACGVRSADCATVLVASPRTGAVAAAHAGWRGTVRGVVGATVRALSVLERASYGRSEPASFVAAIGPHIERCCFEVGDDVAAELAACSPAGDAAVDRSREKAHVDLRAILKAQLVDAGLAVASIEQVPGCTYCDAASFFSYRRDGARSGRLMSAIVARGPR